MAVAFQAAILTIWEGRTSQQPCVPSFLSVVMGWGWEWSVKVRTWSISRNRSYLLFAHMVLLRLNWLAGLGWPFFKVYKFSMLFNLDSLRLLHKCSMPCNWSFCNFHAGCNSQGFVLAIDKFPVCLIIFVWLEDICFLVTQTQSETCWCWGCPHTMD